MAVVLRLIEYTIMLVYTFEFSEGYTKFNIAWFYVGTASSFFNLAVETAQCAVYIQLILFIKEQNLYEAK